MLYENSNANFTWKSIKQASKISYSTCMVHFDCPSISGMNRCTKISLVPNVIQNFKRNLESICIYNENWNFMKLKNFAVYNSVNCSILYIIRLADHLLFQRLVVSWDPLLHNSIFNYFQLQSRGGRKSHS